jgi:hypothetical protein
MSEAKQRSHLKLDMTDLRFEPCPSQQACLAFKLTFRFTTYSHFPLATTWPYPSGPEWSGDDWDPALVSAGGATMLPHGMWCGAAVTGGSGGGTVLEAGWFIPDRDAVYLPRAGSDGAVTREGAKESLTQS